MNVVCFDACVDVDQVKSEEVQRWLDAVEELLSRDASGFSHGDKLQEELNQCKVRGQRVKYVIHINGYC